MKSGFLMFACLLTGCVSMDFTSARSVSVKPGHGGVVSLSHPDDPRSREKGVAIMRQTCQGKEYEIQEEGEVVVGSRSSSTAESSTSRPSGVPGISFGSSAPSTQTESVQSNLTEWRVTYGCKG